MFVKKEKTSKIYYRRIRYLSFDSRLHQKLNECHYI